MPNPRPTIVGGTDGLEPIAPQEAYEWYLDDRKPELTDVTFYAHSSRLGHFVRWCETVADIENLNVLIGRSTKRYKTWRRNEGGVNRVSVRTQLSTLKVILRWCEGVDAVALGLHELVQPPTLKGNETVDDRMLSPGQTHKTIGYLSKYVYVSFKHTLFEVISMTGMRLGGCTRLTWVTIM